MIYRFTTKHGTSTATYDLSCGGDLDARRKAENSATCIRVETPSGRVVWRKPLSPAEFRDVMTGVRSGGRTRKERV